MRQSIVSRVFDDALPYRADRVEQREDTLTLHFGTSVLIYHTTILDMVLMVQVELQSPGLKPRLLARVEACTLVRCFWNAANDAAMGVPSDAAALNEELGEILDSIGV